MIHASTQDQALSFYRAALSTARLIDRDNDHGVLDADADAAWRAYGSDLPAAVRETEAAQQPYLPPMSAHDRPSAVLAHC